MKVALIGLGFIGSTILNALKTTLSSKFELRAIYDIDTAKINAVVKTFPNVRLMFNVRDFDDCDLIIEAASQEVVNEVFNKVIRLQKYFIPMSVGAFTTYDEIYTRYSKLNEEQKKRILLPAGAIGGFDAIKAIAGVSFNEVMLETHKPLRVFLNDPYVIEHKIKLSSDKPTLIFEGNAKEAAKNFPKSINVASRLALATLGPQRTKVKIYADPTVKRNVHKIFINSIVGNYIFTFENYPSPANPRTSWLAALSVVSLLSEFSSLEKK